MKLDPHHVGMVFNLPGLHQLPIGRQSGHYQSGVFQGLAIGVVQLEPVAMPLPHQTFPVSVHGQCIRHWPAGIPAQPHSAAHLGNPALVGHDVYDRVGRIRVQFGRIGGLQAHHITGPLDYHYLQPQAQAQVRHLVLPRVLDRVDHSFHPARAEATGDYYAARTAQQRVGAVFFHVFGVHPLNVHCFIVVQPGVAQGFPHRQVGVWVLHVLAHQCDGHSLFDVFHPLDHAGPISHTS